MQSDDSGSWSDLATTDAATYLNQARCQCAWPVQILVQMAAGSVSKLSSLNATGTGARLYVGNDCSELNSDNHRVPMSHARYAPPEHSRLSAGSWSVPTTVDKLFAAVGDCSATQNTTIWLWLDSTGKGHPDSSVRAATRPAWALRWTARPRRPRSTSRSKAARKP